jgi:hypothetical protein
MLIMYTVLHVLNYVRLFYFYMVYCQSQHEDLTEGCHKAQVTQAEERSKLESQVQNVKDELTQAQAGHKKSLNSLKVCPHSLCNCYFLL